MEPSGPDTIQVIWNINEGDRCTGSFEVCWNDGVHPVETCDTVTPGGGGGGSVGGNGYYNFTITDLLPCNNYEIGVSAVSPGGIIGDTVFNSTSTQDVGECKCSVSYFTIPV